MKVVIAAQNFNIRIADTRQAHADQRPAGLQSRLRLLHQRKTISTSDRGEHPILAGLPCWVQDKEIERAADRYWSRARKAGQAHPEWRNKRQVRRQQSE